MQVNYDPHYNVAYIKLREKSDEIETIKISDELNVDISADGKIYGFELLNANDQLGIKGHPIFTFINENNHQKQELPLSL